MKTLLYKEDTINLFEFLQCQTPKQIYSDEHCQVVLNYENFHITAFPEGFVAASKSSF